MRMAFFVASYGLCEAKKELTILQGVEYKRYHPLRNRQRFKRWRLVCKFRYVICSAELNNLI